ncbi:PfkB family carbohydrate kinase [Consotaella aegiceratis]|uniref:PfkB family carbohydrate kinase n=1 Tax=Consotaella aegiceratis TaxID=3097961 RepID=UPI002F41B024
MPSSHPVILLAGAAHIDRRARAVDGFVPAASNPGRLVAQAGGSVLNAGLALRAAGAKATYLGARGGDADGELVGQTLAEAGIHDCPLTWLDRTTPSYTAILDDRGDLVAGIADMALYDLLSPRAFQRRHIRTMIAEADALLVDANLPPRSVEYFVREAGARPSAAIGVSPAKVVRLSGALPDLSVLFVSRAEACALAQGDPDAGVGALAFRLRALGCRRAVVTDGPRSAAILEDGAVQLQAPIPISDSMDVTGAGDTLAGIALLSLCRGLSLYEGARLGMASAMIRIATGTLTATGFERDVPEIANALPAPECYFEG